MEEDESPSVGNKKCINASGIGEPFIYQLNSITSTIDCRCSNTTTIIPAIIFI